MFKLKFSANIAHASLGDNCRVGLSNDNNFRDYILIQKSHKMGNNVQADCVYVECNGKVCYDGCTKAVLTKDSLNVVIENTPVIVNIKEAKIDDKFVNCLREILGDLLEVQYC